MANFETETAKSFNRHFSENNINGLGYRFEKSSRYTIQPCDVLVDSLDRRFYLAIECKSIKYTNQKQIYFSSTFSKTKSGESQIEHMFEFCNKTGRRGFVAVELKKNPREAYLIPFNVVYDLYSDLRPGIPIEAIREGFKLKREKGSWILDNFI